jgi:hypothetical protein
MISTVEKLLGSLCLDLSSLKDDSLLFTSKCLCICVLSESQAIIVAV